MKRASQWYIVVSWVLLGIIGLPFTTLYIQSFFIPAKDRGNIYVLGPNYYPMTIVFTALFGLILGIITARFIILLQNGERISAGKLSLWAGTLLSAFFAWGTIDGFIRSMSEPGRGAHTDLMGVPALAWALVIVAMGIICRIARQ